MDNKPKSKGKKRKPKTKKEPKQKQSQRQQQNVIVNIHDTKKKTKRSIKKSSNVPAQSRIPQTFITMNAPAQQPFQPANVDISPLEKVLQQYTMGQSVRDEMMRDRARAQEGQAREKERAGQQPEPEAEPEFRAQRAFNIPMGDEPAEGTPLKFISQAELMRRGAENRASMSMSEPSYLKEPVADILKASPKERKQRRTKDEMERARQEKLYEEQQKAFSKLSALLEK